MPILSDFNLSGRVAVLATAGGDEAPFLASALAEANATVFVIARRQTLLDPVLEALEAQGNGEHDGIAAELADPAGLARAMQALDQRFGKVDVLVNDARSMLSKPFHEITLEEWDEVQARNVRATFLICQEVGKRMVDNRYGRIVNLVSGLAERGMINGSAFAASQAAILALTRSLAVELGTSNIRVNALGTGWFSSQDVPIEVQLEELLVRYTPLRRKGHPRDIGPLLVYLCSEACDYVTGQPVYVDGGLNAHP
jgi:NAD(P)-dependent dehydrogenase (short-subunit alcohol dehydrogenase family)